MEKKVKKQLTREEFVAAQQQMKQIALSANREEQIASIINETYDPELPINEVVSAIMNVGSAEPQESVYYFVPTLPIKKVYILTSNCNVTQEAVVPTSKNTLSFTTIVTPDYYICLDTLLNGDMNVLDLYAEDIQEALNREEIYAVLALVDAAAVARGNVFGLDSGKTKFDYPKLVEMKKAIRKYGKTLVLISGSNITEDIELMQYDANKFQGVNIKDVVDLWIPIESLDVTIGGADTDVISDDIAYLVAVSDSKKNKPGYFIRRKISSAVAGLMDTTVIAKERAVIVTGTNKPVATVEKFARGIAGLEQVGVVITNSYTCCKFVRA
jgi:hypothetical protein